MRLVILEKQNTLTPPERPVLDLSGCGFRFVLLLMYCVDIFRVLHIVHVVSIIVLINFIISLELRSLMI